MEQRGIVLGAIAAAVVVAGGLFYFLVPGEQDANNLALRANDGAEQMKQAEGEGVNDAEALTAEEAQRAAESAGGTLVSSPNNATPTATPVSPSPSPTVAGAHDVPTTAETGAGEAALLAAIVTIGLGGAGFWLTWRLS